VADQKKEVETTVFVKWKK